MSTTARSRMTATVFVIAVATTQAWARQDAKETEAKAFEMPTYGLMSDLIIPAVRREIGLTPAQLASLEEKARKIADDIGPQEGAAIVRENRIEARRRPGQGRSSYDVTPDLRGPSYEDVFLVAMDRSNAAVKQVLTARQFERLVQISRQESTFTWEVMRIASDGYKHRLDAKTIAEYQELVKKAQRAKDRLYNERHFALTCGYRSDVIDELIRKKTVEINAAYYQRLLALMPKDFRKRWLDYIGPTSHAIATCPGYYRFCEDLYDPMLIVEKAQGDIPFSPYLDLPDGETSGKEDPEFPRVMRKK